MTVKGVLATVGVGAIVLAVIGYLWNDGRVTKEQLKKAEQQHTEELQKLDQRLIEQDAKIAADRDEIEGMREQQAADRAKFQAKIDELKRATPLELVAEARRILKTDEITWNGTTVEFSLAAFRDNVFVLVRYEEITTKTIPNYEKQLAAFETLVADHEAKEKIQADKIKELEDLSKDYVKYITTQKKSSIFDKILWVAGAFLVGFALAK